MLSQFTSLYSPIILHSELNYPQKNLKNAQYNVEFYPSGNNFTLALQVTNLMSVQCSEVIPNLILLLLPTLQQAC